jgi:hypothetical protein
MKSHKKFKHIHKCHVIMYNMCLCVCVLLSTYLVQGTVERVIYPEVRLVSA